MSTKTTIQPKDLARFIILSTIGIFLFFIPVSGTQVPVVWLVNFVKSVLGIYLKYIIVVSCWLLLGSVILGKVFKIERFRKYHENDGVVRTVFFVLAVIFSILILSGFGPNTPFQHPKIGGNVLNLTSTVITTIVIAGWAVVFILKSGIVEFIGILIEPIMRPIYQLPGQAAVDAVSSFVSSASVGVYFTELYYKSGVYTEREACSVTTNFSVISIGYIGVLCGMVGIQDYYSTVVIVSFCLVFVLAAITVRLPPLSLKRQIYFDGTPQSAQRKKVEKMDNRFKYATEVAVNKSKEFTAEAFFASLINAVKFAQKIVAVTMPIIVIVLTVVYYTPVFDIISKPIAPILALLGMPNAVEIAPAVIIGLMEVTLPCITISGLDIATQSAFFVVVLSTVQIIFFSEAGNAMLGSSIPVNLKDLVFIFCVRTVIAVPLVALVSHLIF